MRILTTTIILAFILTACGDSGIQSTLDNKVTTISQTEIQVLSADESLLINAISKEIYSDHSESNMISETDAQCAATAAVKDIGLEKLSAVGITIEKPRLHLADRMFSTAANQKALGKPYTNSEANYMAEVRKIEKHFSECVGMKKYITSWISSKNLDESIASCLLENSNIKVDFENSEKLFGALELDAAALVWGPPWEETGKQIYSEWYSIVKDCR